MTTTDQFMLGLQAYQEVMTELHQGKSAPITPTQVTGTQITEKQKDSLPGGTIMFGLAEDGLPLLFDLYDPAPGPLLVAGDGGSGKTALLKSLARATNQGDPGEIQFGVLTPFPEEWNAEEALPNCLGIWPAYHPAACDFLSQIISWAEALPKTSQVVVVLIDGLDLITGNDLQVKHLLRWLLMCGPEHQIWPVVTVNPGRMTQLETWLQYFQTRLIGRVKHPQTARRLVEDPGVDLSALLPGVQFGLSRPDGWLKFHMPPVL